MSTLPVTTTANPVIEPPPMDLPRRVPNAVLPIPEPPTPATSSPSTVTQLQPPPPVPAHLPVADTFPDAVEPPPYAPPVETEELPDYWSKTEPYTLAKTLFWLGFLFPPCWMLAWTIIPAKLHPIEEWKEIQVERGKTEAEQAKLLAVIRSVELKWAWRCVYAFFATLLLVIIALVVLKFAILKH